MLSSQLLAFLQHLRFAEIAFMPHGMCYLWKPWLVSLHLASNGIIALAYFSIPFTLVYILRKRRDIPFNSIFLLFAAFILFCGITHAFDIWTLWYANYWLAGWLKLLTAVISGATAIALIIKIPQILTLPSPNQIEEINRQLTEKIELLQQQKATIHTQEQFLRNIYDDVLEAIFVVDVAADGLYYQGFNQAAQKLTGLDNRDVVNKTPAQIFPPQAAVAVERNYQQCIDTQTTITYEECLPFNSEDTWWLTTLNPVQDEEGKIYRIIGTSLNISDRKRAEIALDRDKNFLQALLDNLSDGIVACDTEGILTLFNRATREFHGLPPEPIAADDWAKYYDLYHSDGKTIMSKEEIPLFRALMGESVRDLEIALVPQQGKPRTLLANGDSIVDSNGKKIGAVVAMRDVSELKKAQQDLANLNEELEARVQQRTNDLKKVNTMLLATTAQLEKRNQELDRFAYVTSHDLKAPLRAINNLSHWIEEDLADSLEGDTRLHMKLMRGRVQRMENLINGLLTYSRVGRMQYDPSEVSVSQLLADIIDSLDVPPKFTIEIPDEMPTLVTELVPLQQVFSNLISNAIQHSDADNGKITISVRERGDFYEFAVADNGKGIAPQYHDKIFTIFQTLEARDTKESTGIGLSIVKKAVESQGGRVVVESQIGAGTTFRFTWKK